MKDDRLKKIEQDAGQLLAIMEKLRSPGGCPWDRKQTHQSLKRYLAEECAELMDALDSDDPEAICEEMGDVMMNLFMNAVIAAELKRFDLGDVLECINAKMIRRHPHVFGDAVVNNADDVLKVWQEVKSREKKAIPESVLDGIPKNLSSLLTAWEIQHKAAKYGFDWSNEMQIVAKIDEELNELKMAMSDGEAQVRIDEEIGDLLFAIVNLVRFRNRITAEDLLAAAIRKFRRRFGHIESELKKSGRPLTDASPEEMEALWQQAKKHQ